MQLSKRFVSWSTTIAFYPNLTFPQLLQEVETQAILSQQQINQTQVEINSKKRDARLNNLTSKELSQLTQPAKVYEGVGKM